MQVRTCYGLLCAEGGDDPPLLAASLNAVPIDLDLSHGSQAAPGLGTPSAALGMCARAETRTLGRPH